MDMLEGLKLQINVRGSPLFHLHKQEAVLLTREQLLTTMTFAELIKVMMLQTMAGTGVGLAAPQTASAYSFAVIGLTPEGAAKWPERYREELDVKPVPPTVIFNPSYTPIEEEGTVTFWEACLTSLEGHRERVKRWNTVEVTYLDSDGEQVIKVVRGWEARIYQHEIDHLHGIVCSSRLEGGDIITAEEYSWYRAEGTLEVTKNA